MRAVQTLPSTETYFLKKRLPLTVHCNKNQYSQYDELYEIPLRSTRDLAKQANSIKTTEDKNFKKSLTLAN